jgi:hypothetical protein
VAADEQRRRPRSAGKFDDQQKGGFDRLPQSVQDAIKSTGLQSTEDIHDISGIVKDGNHDPQPAPKSTGS